MEEKSAPEFALPSPNFNKQNGPSKVSLHYLTPCGMTLLPRGKQPPPMYGARGSTVPAKYLKEDTPQPQKVAEITSPVYKSPPRPEHCNNCSMELASSQDMKRHLQQHEICPADDCDFSALSNILDRHMEANHITGLYQKVKKVWTPEDIANWRAERRKRFPTTANVELAKRAKEQRMKRGERLEASKSRFGQVEDRKRTRIRSQHQQRDGGSSEMKPNNKRKTKHNSHKSNPQQKKTKIVKEQSNMEKVKEENSTEPAERFRGTSEMLDYKHFKDKKTVGNVLTNLLGMYGSDSDDDEDEKVSDSCLEDSAQYTDGKVVAKFESVTSVEQPQLIESTLPTSDDNDEAPDEVPIERLKEQDEQPVLNRTEIIQKSHNEKDKPMSSGKPTVKQVIIPTKKRQNGLNFKRAKQTYKQSTMLSKLLASDIRHERNVLLQCVRYVCERDFFGIEEEANNVRDDPTG